MAPSAKIAAIVLALTAASVSYFRKPIYQTASQTVYGKICGVNADFDYAVIGAGTAGAVTAYKLSENPDLCVLLESDGGDPSTLTFPDDIELPPPFCKIPSFPPPWPTAAIKDYTYEPTDPVNTMQPYIVKNKVWGGASAWNTLVVDSNDCAYYDAFVASIPGAAAAGYDCASVQAVFRKLTTFHAPPDYPLDPNVNGVDGPIGMTVWNPDAATMTWIQAFANYTGTTYQHNFNTNHGLGVGMVQRGIDVVDGEFVRQNTFIKTLVDTGFWNAQGTGTRNNLVVRSYVTVKKLLIRASHRKPHIYGYTYEQAGQDGGIIELASGGEVILTAGQPSTLQLLQLSGIGDCNYLASLAPAGIQCVYNNPSVGNSTQNTQQLAMIYVVKIPWQGREDCGSGNAYLLSQLAKSLGQSVTDIALGFVQFLPYPWPGSSDPTLYTSILVLPAVYRNQGNPVGQFGTHKIRDADPESFPKTASNTNPNVMSDAVKAAEGVCAYLNNVMNVSCVRVSPTGPLDTDAEIASFALSADFNDFAHMYAGAAIGGSDVYGNPNPGAVVDLHMRVYGVKGLRIGDLSVWPGTPLQIPKHSFMYSALISGYMVGQFTLSDRNSI
jgi:choline dehydrogenase